MKCPFCSVILADTDKRCHACGKSLTTRIYHPATRTEEEVPYYRQTEAQKRRTHLIVNVLIAIVSTVVVAGIAALLLFRAKPSLFIRDQRDRVALAGSTFDVVQMDEDYYQEHGTTNKVVIPFTITNKTSAALTHVEARIYASSRDLQIWSSKGVVDVFTFVSPAAPLAGGESRVVTAEFPVTYQPMGLAKIRWDYDLLKVE